MPAEIYEILTKSPLFTGISAKEIEEILKRIRHRIKTYKKGNIIAFKGAACEELLVLIKGSVRGEMVDFSGKAVEIEMINAPRPLAPAFLFGKNNLFPVDAVANGDVTLFSIPKSSLITLFQLNTKVLLNYLETISSRARFLSEKLHFMSFKTIKEKIAHYLLSLAKPQQEMVVLPRNHRELSEFFAVSRPSLSRVFVELEKEGIISYDRKKVTIKDRDKLNKILGENL